DPERGLPLRLLVITGTAPARRGRPLPHPEVGGDPFARRLAPDLGLRRQWEHARKLRVVTEREVAFEGLVEQLGVLASGGQRRAPGPVQIIARRFLERGCGAAERDDPRGADRQTSAPELASEA